MGCRPLTGVANGDLFDRVQDILVEDCEEEDPFVKRIEMIFFPDSRRGRSG